MTEQRIAEVAMSQQYNNPTLEWKQKGYAELETAMNSPIWKLDPKRLLQLANGKSDTKDNGGVSADRPPSPVQPHTASVSAKIETKNLIKKVPEFPTDIAFSDAFGMYWKAYGNKNEVCPAFHFASALAQISQGLGRRFYINGRVGRHYPNWYQALIGTSFIAAKSKVGEDTSDAIRDIYEIDEDSCDIYKQTTVF